MHLLLETPDGAEARGGTGALDHDPAELGRRPALLKVRDVARPGLGSSASSGVGAWCWFWRTNLGANFRENPPMGKNEIK